MHAALQRVPLLQIVNLVSNDVRRFDDAMAFYNFLIGGPGQQSQQQRHNSIAAEALQHCASAGAGGGILRK